jgi:Domain of unknown function (DUF4268)
MLLLDRLSRNADLPAKLITNERNWSKFQGVFEPMEGFAKLMGPVREIRNQLAHFRGRLHAIQRDALIQALNWLATRPKVEAPKVVIKQVFFADVLSRLKTARPGITRSEKALPQSWFSFGAGRSGSAFAWVFTRDVRNQPVLRVELYIDTGDRDENKKAYDALLNQREGIEKEIGLSLQ